MALFVPPAGLVSHVLFHQLGCCYTFCPTSWVVIALFVPPARLSHVLFHQLGCYIALNVPPAGLLLHFLSHQLGYRTFCSINWVVILHFMFHQLDCYRTFCSTSLVFIVLHLVYTNLSPTSVIVYSCTDTVSLYRSGFSLDFRVIFSLIVTKKIG